MSSGVPTTWAGNRAYRFERWHEPTAVGELRDIVAKAARVRVVGSRHCFNDIADSPDGDLVSLRSLPREVDVDGSRGVARVSAWSTYAEIAPVLHAAGWALPNTASLPHITVGGAIATGSHGSGVGNQSLAGPVVGLEYVDAQGRPQQIDRSEPDFAGHVVALGALGVWTHVQLAIAPTFEVAQTIRLDLPWDDVLADPDAVLGSAYSLSLFTDYAGPTVAQAWLKARTDQPAPTLDLGHPAAEEAVHMLAGADPAAVTAQQGVPGPWHERLPHFRADHVPSRGAELQSEYFVPRERAVEALGAMRELASRSTVMRSVLQVAEIRSIAADDLWLSGAAGAAMIGLHFTWVLDSDTVTIAVAEVEEALLPLGARPHWGKVFGADAAALAPCYPRLADFWALRARLDPDQVFDNPYLRRVIGAARVQVST